MIDRRLIRFVQHDEVDPVSAQFIVNKLIPKAARAFHGILKQGAFITLGFALIALVAKLRDLLLPYSEPVTRKKEKKIKKENKVIPSSEDVGEAIGEDLGEDVGPETNIGKHNTDKISKKHSLKEKSSSDKKKKKKVKKKGSSAIDDIFG